MRAKTWVEVNRANLVHNLAEFRKRLAPGTALMAVVKSNAYGHGAREVATSILGSPKANDVWFGVDSVQEGAALRKHVGRAPILVLGYTPHDHLALAAKHDLRLTIYNRETIRALLATKTRGTIRVHVKVETGTTRQGVGERELLDFVKTIKRTPGLLFEGLSTHYANIEDTADPRYAMLQRHRFEYAEALLERAGIRVPMKHTACTAAILLFPETHFNLARLGIGLYGLWPSSKVRDDGRARGIHLRPALVWKTIIAQIKAVPKGTPVGYGLSERVRRASRIAVLPIGYWDGFDRGLSSCGEVFIRGKRCKIVGRVCMNMCMADVTHISGVRAEDEVTLLGKTVSADEIAQKLETVNYEIVTRINPLIPRVLV
jgi:alanine racemase